MGQDGLALAIEKDISASPRTTRLRHIDHHTQFVHLFGGEALLQILRCMNASFLGLD